MVICYLRYSVVLCCFGMLFSGVVCGNDLLLVVCLMLRFIIGRDFELVGWVVYDMFAGFLRLDDFVL